MIKFIPFFLLFVGMIGLLWWAGRSPNAAKAKAGKTAQRRSPDDDSGTVTWAGGSVASTSGGRADRDRENASSRDGDRRDDSSDSGGGDSGGGDSGGGDGGGGGD
jgi:hypothetical protein